ncbi:MAG: HAD family hydrolase [Candidatus Omnitrophica bacterium]|nr:HAD family hydrolase [Candidatus Omnitrophota bacterium]
MEFSLSDYINMDKNRMHGRKNMRFDKKIKIAVLGSFTLNGFKETLNVKCKNAGIKASFYIGDYRQYANELIDKKSRLYGFRPDITFLLIDVKSVLGELFFNPYGVSANKRMKLVKANYAKLNSLIIGFLKYGSGILVTNNFEVPAYSPMGILESRERFGYFEMIKELNARISRFNSHNSIFVFDYDSFASSLGKNNITDEKLAYLADMKISPDTIPLLCEEYMRYVRALSGLSRKCIVLDMDNTLWGGIVGEDGLEGIRLGPEPPGNAYMEFQKYLLALFERGVILAANSSNNAEDVLKVLRKHPYEVLRERHFASLKINWENKVKNLVEIAKDINIGLDSMIFLEDDKRIRGLVKAALPQVLCPDMPEDPSSYPGFLKGIKELDTLQFTLEDKKRSARYVAERSRKELAGAFKSIPEYLKQLSITVEIGPVDKFSIPRIAQLTTRTNQFNFSSKRYQEKEIEGLARDKRYGVYYVSAKDKFGDYGITGAIIARKNKHEWLVDNLLLSCRILGRKIEEAVLVDIMRRAEREKAAALRVVLTKTEKNMPVFNFLKNHDLIPENFARKNALVTIYERDKKPGLEGHIKHIKVVSK